MFSPEDSLLSPISGVADLGKAVLRSHSEGVILEFEGISAGLGDLVNLLNRIFEDCSLE